MDDASALVEAKALDRALRSHGNDVGDGVRWAPTFVLMATTARYDPARLQVALDLGAGYGVAGLLLGWWRPGVTVYVGADGIAVPTGQGLGRVMRDHRLGGIDADAAVRRLTRLGRGRSRRPSSSS